MVAIKDRCIGCGVCALACPREAIKLKKMADVVPPVTRKEAFLRYGQERMW